MKYYSEDDVISIMRDVEDSVTAYEWGCGNRNVKLADYPSVEIPDNHWNTETPAEDGDYWIAYKWGLDNAIMHNMAKVIRYGACSFNGGQWNIEHPYVVVAWKNIEPYKEES